MTLPANTALQITIQYQPKSFAEIVAAKRERDKRLRPHERPLARVKPTLVAPPAPAPEEPPPQAPLWQREEIQFDAHCELFGEWRINPPRAYVIAHAKRMGSSYHDIRKPYGGPGSRDTVKVRATLMLEVFRIFHLTFPQIGKLFGRDHSTVAHTLEKFGIKSAVFVPTSTHADQIYKMWRRGMSHTEIAKQLGYAQSAISRYIGKQPWSPKKSRQKMYVRDYADKVREMMDDGATNAEIAAHLGFQRDGITKFIKKQGWTR